MDEQYGEAFKIGQWLCIITILFASGDIWPTISMGFTFRLSQLTLMLAAGALLLQLRWSPLLLFPGWLWLCAFALWIVICLPWSLYLDRSLGYVFFGLLDCLLILVFIQYFRTESQLRLLVSAVMWSYIAISVFGFSQLFAGMLGIELLTQEWWIPGRLPRINGISYEPSYYATYLLPGVVLAEYLLRHDSEVVSRWVLKLCLVLGIGAIVFSTSRLGWMVLLTWWALKYFLRLLNWASSPRFSKRLVLKFSLSSVLILIALAVVMRHFEDISDLASGVAFLSSGITLPGEGGGSSDGRLQELRLTLEAFFDHPIMGTGIGALPVLVGAQRGILIQTLGDAKTNEGMSIFVELLASTGMVGGVLVLGFCYRVIKSLMLNIRHMPKWRRDLAIGSSAALFWILFALQFNQNFLRVYLFINTAVLICSIRVPLSRLTAGPRPVGESRSHESAGLSDITAYK